MNLNLQWGNPIFFNVSENMFCEPYPTCLEGNQGAQDTSNCSSMHSLIQKPIDSFSKIRAYPNPFNPSTRIKFNIKRKTNIKVEIIDVLGKKVNILFKGIKDLEYNTLNGMVQIVGVIEYPLVFIFVS